MLNYQAHVAGGHYAIETIAANSEAPIDLIASSYNSYNIVPERIHVINNNNSGNVEIYIAGNLASAVPPYSSKDIQIKGLLNTVIKNLGTTDCKIVVVDKLMIEFAQDIYASLTISGSDSDIAIVNNFEQKSLSDIVNEGYLTNISYSFTNARLIGGAKFGAKCLELSSQTLPARSNLTIYNPDLFDFSRDFTITGFVKGTWCSVNTPAFTFYNKDTAIVTDSLSVKTLSGVTPLKIVHNNIQLFQNATSSISPGVNYSYFAITLDKGIFWTSLISSTLSVTSVFNYTIVPALAASKYDTLSLGMPVFDIPSCTGNQAPTFDALAYYKDFVLYPAATLNAYPSTPPV